MGVFEELLSGECNFGKILGYDNGLIVSLFECFRFPKLMEMNVRVVEDILINRDSVFPLERVCSLYR